MVSIVSREQVMANRSISRATPPLSVGQLAALACIAEVSAPKVGNVHPGASFADVTHMDFIASALAIAPHLDLAAERGVGATVLACVKATRAVCQSNTNLGMILLLAPLCAVPRRQSLVHGIDRVLASLTPRDARDVYAAIRLAKPGGLGKARAGDVRRHPPKNLIDAMRLAADRDAIARQYVNSFADVFNPLVLWLTTNYHNSNSLQAAIGYAHLQQLECEPDSLIRRKCGDEIALEAQRRVINAMANGQRRPKQWQREVNQLDRWFRADGNRRNPGTSADLIAAALFVCFREGTISLPFKWGDGGLPLSL